MGSPPRGVWVRGGGPTARGRRRPWRALAVGVVLLGVVALPSQAVEPEGSAAPDDPREERRAAAEEAREELRAAVRDAREGLRAANDHLRAARAATAAARARERAADGAVRSAEEQVVPALLDRRDAREQLRLARRQIRALQGQIRGAQADLEVARDRLADRVVRAYKQGSVAADTVLPLLAAREAASPGELVQTLKNLEVLALVGATDVEDLLALLDRLEEELDLAVAARDEARAAERDADERVGGAEETAAARRGTALATEAGLLQALSRELAVEQRRQDARDELQAALADLGTGEPGAPEAEADAGQKADEDGEEADDEDRLSTEQRLRGRQRAHARQASLPGDARRAADDWACPVAGGRFLNDWAFPRSHDRKHEGTDVFAATGTPVVAVMDGTVAQMTTVDRYDGRGGLGGITVTYEQGDQRVYNAHLDAIHPDVAPGRDVSEGDVIGWVGRTGNARGTPPHLHLGWYVDDVAVNAYASLAVACHDVDPDDAAAPDALDDPGDLEELMGDLEL